MRKSIETGGLLGAGSCPAPSAHRLDEFPAGYSLAGCSPAAPASASPAVCQYAAAALKNAMLFQRAARVSVFHCLSDGVHAILKLKAVPNAPNAPKAVPNAHFDAWFTVCLAVQRTRTDS